MNKRPFGGLRVLIAAMLFSMLAAVVCLTGCGNVDAPDGNGGNNNVCTVLFFENGGSAVAPQSIKYGKKVVRPADPTRDGYEFGGWFISKNYKIEWRFDTDTVKEDPLMLFAKWTPDGSVVDPPDDDEQYCSVMFMPECDATVPSQSVKIGSKISAPDPIFKPDYTFDGWYDGDKKWDFDADVTTGESLVLRAKWIKNEQPQPETCIVTFVTDCTVHVPQAVLNVGSKISEPSGVRKEGYTLDGWYNGSKKWSFDTDTVSGKALTLTAKWTKNPDIIGQGDSVTVTFNVGYDARKDGLSNPAAVTKKAGSTITEPAVSRAGYDVTGWYVEEGNTKWNFATDKLTQNVTLFAKWQTSIGGGGDRVDYTPTMTQNNTLYLHYQRNNNDYDGWTAWVWTTGNGRRYTSVATDISGTVIAVDLAAWGNPSTIKFKIAVISESNDWGEADGGDCTLDLSSAQKVGGSYHWYVKEGNTSNGKNYLSDGSSGGPVGGDIRESIANVDRSNAQNMPVMKTVQGWDEVGVGYQIFVASFCDSNGDGVGDLNGITSKLDYLQSLNVDVLWLTPVQSSNSYHGYDCYDYYSIDKKFGTNADYRKLVYEVHKRGMKIIMDLVVNHTSPQNEWFVKSKAGVTEKVTYQDGTSATVNYRDFYRWKRRDQGGRWYSGGSGYAFYSSFGSNMPELNYDYQPVRDAMTDVASYWMNYGLDGFRMDAIKHLYMSDECENDYSSGDVEGGVNDKPYNYNLTKNVEFFREFNYRLKTKYPHCFLLGEQLNGNVNDVSPFYAGMDSLFDFNTYFDLPGRLDGDAGAQANAFNSNAAKYRQYRGDRPINSMISSNHDVERLNYKTGGSTDKAKLYMSVILTMPGLSWIYYGDEIGLVGDKAGGKGDDGLRQSMKWDARWSNKCTAIHDYSINGSTRSVDEQKNDDDSLLSRVQKLAKFRNDNPALISGNATCSEQDGMLKITVSGGGKTYNIYHNFGSGQKSVSGNVVFNSSTGGGNTVSAYGTVITA